MAIFRFKKTFSRPGDVFPGTSDLLQNAPIIHTVHEKRIRGVEVVDFSPFLIFQTRSSSYFSSWTLTKRKHHKLDGCIPIHPLLIRETSLHFWKHWFFCFYSVFKVKKSSGYFRRYVCFSVTDLHAASVSLWFNRWIEVHVLYIRNTRGKSNSTSDPMQ